MACLLESLPSGKGSGLFVGEEAVGSKEAVFAGSPTMSVGDCNVIGGFDVLDLYRCIPPNGDEVGRLRVNHTNARRRKRARCRSSPSQSCVHANLTSEPTREHDDELINSYRGAGSAAINRVLYGVCEVAMGGYAPLVPAGSVPAGSLWKVCVMVMMTIGFEVCVGSGAGQAACDVGTGGTAGTEL
ncbi:hypothetical protein K470DRAFT_54608 [Piedraia hortae CBS 480.64]|uniref:Uncharacterized protein n=1 Tax=Piedraia hortae CBS 480.64 TaxID=1314780 RepID=A0A6A7CB21_9PEZI|nr:hypothetical protein K470DRAFT_54608 [Piedraia hortae CBS 480.64]